MSGRTVVFAGLTGVRIGGFIGEAVRYLKLRGLKDVFGAKFEDYLRVEMGLADLESVAFQILSASREAVRERFRAALDRLLEDADGADVIVVGVHLTYHSRGVMAPNPVLRDILSIGDNITLIYLVEDYYDALYRVARGWAEKSARAAGDTLFPSYHLDPITYLQWRGAEMSLIDAVKGFLGELRVFLLGAKHPPSVLRAILDYAVLGRCVIHVYLSHPITLFRRLRLAGARPPRLADVPGVLEIEEIARSLEGLRVAAPTGEECRVAVYRPTTVDELIVIPAALALQRLGCSGGPAKGSGVVIDPIIDSSNRWPFTGFHEDYVHKNRDGKLSMVSDKYMMAAFGGAVRALREELCAGGGHLTDLILSMVRAQIEMRDYSYIDQSNVVATVIPVFYKIDYSRGECMIESHVVLAEGVEAEARRAHALAKRLVAVILPVSLDRVKSVVCGHDEDCRDSVESIVEGSARLSYRHKVGDGRGGCGGEDEVRQAMFRVAEGLRGSGRERPLSPLGVLDAIALAPETGRAAGRLAKLFY